MRGIKVAKIILFCVIFLFFLNRIYEILSWKDTAGEYYSSVDSYYALEEDVVDVLFLGSSRCYCSINNAVLWEEHGIGSFSLAISGQDFAGTYYTLKEALKTQTPEIVFVELYGSIFDGYLAEGNLYRSTLPFKYSKNNYDAINSLVEEKEKRKDFWLKWPILHTRYREVQKEDFAKEREPYIGYHAEFRTQGIAPIELYQGEEMIPLPPEREQWLRKMIALAEENEIQVCFFIAPYAVTEQDQKIFKYVEGIAEEHNIPVLNMLALAEELGLDYGKDFIDWAHTNYNGALKVSDYVGDYLAANYDLPDRRGDARYALWEENSRVRQREAQNRALQTTNDIASYLNVIQNIQGYVVVLATVGDHKTTDADISVPIEAAGMKELFDTTGGIWVYEDGVMTYSNGEDTLHHMDLGSSDLVASCVDGVRTINVDKQIHKRVEHGINIVVYDKMMGEVVDVLGFSAPHSYGLAR